MATFFKNALLVEISPPSVQEGSLRQVDGKIVAVGSDISAKDGDEVIDCKGAVLMPGLVNGHTHLYSALAVGMPAPPRTPQNFHEILELIWWRLDRAHDLVSVRACGQVGALAALRSGTTTFIDHHASPNAIEGSLESLESGIAEVGQRGVLCYEMTDRNYETESELGLKENERYFKACQEKSNGKFAGLIGAHASFTLTEESLGECAELAKNLQTGVHIHVAEDPVDEKITKQEYGCGVVERLKKHGILEIPNTIIAHGTHLSEKDWAVLGEHKDTLTLAHNPNSNMNNGVGYTPVAKAPLPVILGTDGIGADMWREARTAQFKSNDARTALPFGESLEMLAESARFASRCLGVTLGKLEVGAVADLVLTDYRPATQLSSENLAGHFIFGMGPEYVKDVMIDGRWCLRDRQVMLTDEKEILAKSRETTSKLHERLAEL